MTIKKIFICNSSTSFRSASCMWWKQQNRSQAKQQTCCTTQTATTQAAAQKSDAALKDGTYKLASATDKRGWHVGILLKVEKSLNLILTIKGERKSADAAYEKSMKDKVGTDQLNTFVPYT